MSASTVPSDGAQVLVDAIDSARDRVWLATGQLASEAVWQALIEAHRRGVDVCVVMGVAGAGAATLYGRGIAIRVAGEQTALHRDLAVIDTNVTVVADRSDRDQSAFVVHRDCPDTNQLHSREFRRLESESVPYLPPQVR